MALRALLLFAGLRPADFAVLVLAALVLAELVLVTRAFTASVLREIEEDCAWAESSPMPEAEQAAYGVFDNSIVPPAFRPEVLKT